MYFPMSDIIPVFLGADLNCYNFARAFHEAYGVESYAYGRYPMAPTKYSKIIHFTTVPDMDNEDTMLRILHEFAAQHKGKRLYLFGCTDDYAAMIIRRKAELTEYIAPGPAADLYGSIQKKAEFYEVCEKFGIPYPDSKILTAPVDAAELTEDKLGFAYPIIVKPSSSVDYWKHPFDTMKKVYPAATRRDRQNDLCQRLPGPHGPAEDGAGRRRPHARADGVLRRERQGPRHVPWPYDGRGAHPPRPGQPCRHRQ